jgi:ABC-type multidrug transport system ATPase subunit
MVNLLRSTSGRIVLFGKPIGQDALHVAVNVGYMPQETHALNVLTVGEALFFTAHLRGMSRANARKERDALLELWQIQEIRDEYSSRLSGGQRRLLRLAVAMAASPPVLILDEPTNDLDPLRRRLVWDVLRRINEEQGTTILFITHDAIEAEKVIQRVGIMRAGELVAVGSPSTLKKSVDRKLRLELLFTPGAPPSLPPGLVPYPVQAGRWIVYLDRAEVTSVLEHMDLDQVDDFRLYSATLEDLYVHYATQT